MRSGRISYDSAEWEHVSPQARYARDAPEMSRQDESPRSRARPQAKTVVQRLLQRDPTLRMSAAELISEPWVLGRDVPGEPMPATHERLLAFTKV